MEFKLVIDEFNLHTELSDQLAERIAFISKNQIESYQISKIIENKVEAIIAESLPELIKNAISVNGETLESRVDSSLNSLIKSKVKKAMK